MAKDSYAILLAVACAIFFFIGVYCGSYQKEYTIEKTSEYKEKLDSIKFKIKQKDSIILALEEKMNYDVQKVYMLDDSTSVQLFEMLVYGRKRYNISTWE